ncbi:SWIM zinc finger family protein [Halobacteria archaeon AArc-dxtr1]|nr:SWIM zinc finger family protein [Halobacteria archaeon AArc-dxtr1]
MNTIASPKASLPVPSPEIPQRALRARTEPMSVLALGDGLYEVESASETTYLVDLEAGRCSCPDHVFRHTRCKHVRRVAIEITDGRTPPPGLIVRACDDCRERVFVPEQTPEPVYCDRHRIRPGDAVRDRETGDRLVAVDVSDRRADAVFVGDGETTVADYATNESYDPDVPVVGAIYPHATVAKNGVVPESLRVYVFPRTRLQRITRDRR